MDPANQEFKELLKVSGWNQSKAAKNLDLTTASISRYMTDTDKPSKQTLRLFQMLLSGECPSASQPMVLREALVSDAGIWRDRAQRAEKELADLKEGMRALLARPAAAKNATGMNQLRAALDTLAPEQREEAKELARKILGK